MTKYRQVGGRLGAYIRANNPSTQQIQGLLADLLAGDPLLPTMREVVTMPAFAALQGLAGSGGGVVQRDALLQELAKRYLPAVVDEAGQLVNGMLHQPAGATTYGSDSTFNPERSPSTTHEQESQAKALKDLQEKYDKVISELDKLNSMQAQGGKPTTQINANSSLQQEKAPERTSAKERQTRAKRSSSIPYKDNTRDLVLGLGFTLLGYIWIGNMLHDFSPPAIDSWSIVPFLVSLGFLVICLLLGAFLPFCGMKKAYRYCYTFVALGITTSFFPGFVLTAKSFWLGVLGFFLWVAPTPMWLLSLVSDEIQ